MQVTEFDPIEFISSCENGVMNFSCPFCLKKYGFDMALKHTIGNKDSHERVKDWLKVHGSCYMKQIERDLNLTDIIDCAKTIFQPTEVNSGRY